MAAKVERTRSAVAGSARKRERCGDWGVASTCWIFLEPARCERIEGHFIAALRSRCRRADQEVEESRSDGE